MGLRFAMPIAQWMNSLGVPLAGGKLYFYTTLTSTPLDTYSDAALTVPNTNPVVADANGVWDDIYLQAADYKVDLKTSAGVQVAGFPVDPVSGGTASSALTFLASGTSAVSRTVQSKLRDVVSAADFGVVGDGSTDDGAALQAWLTAIPVNGAGYLPAAATSYYKSTVALTRSGRTRIYGDGLSSRIHYTGSGVALTLTNARFTKLDDFYLTGTASATGGIYVKSAQQGFATSGLFVEAFTGASAYALRFSSCWTLNMIGGRANGTTGLLFDTTNDSVSGINNSINLIQVDCSSCTTGIDFQKGFAVNILGCDFSTTTTGIEIGRALAGTDTARNVSIRGCYFESTNAIYIGRGNTSSSGVAYVEIANNYINGSSNGIHIYVADSVIVGEQTFGAGTNTIDAGVTGTSWMTTATVTDNSTTGQTTYLRGTSGFFQAKQFIATTVLGSPAYTVSTLPSAGTPGRVIYVSNESGGAVLAFSDSGSNWRRVTDRAIVS